GEDERRFTVVVADTTAPSLVPPAPLELVSATPVARDDPAVAAFLAGATASDLVDPAPAVMYEAPASFPMDGTAEVTFTATDRSGNSSSATSTVTVAALSRPPAPLDLHAALGSGLVRLAWRVPADAQVERFEITRTARDGAPVTIYTGTAATFLDRGVENGITYRYAVSSVDASEMRSDEVLVVARPVASRLVTPLDGARLVAPPLLRWTAPARATYYNVQLWRNGRKILSAWPSSPRLRLHASWTYRGRTFRLVPGTYVWYVWPGYGRRASARYGKALGHRAFFVTG
ncbi:MAG: hypothetical protein ICV74_06115, partial [Thermoleophilia bacterium]|nr:hypothetical protein [Thermoleophilia bacterium]